MFGRPANSGCVGSTPLSTIAIGTPGPGGGARSAPMCASHHSCGCKRIAQRACRVVAAAVPRMQSATSTTLSRRRRTSARSVASSPARAQGLCRSRLEPRRPRGDDPLRARSALCATPGVDVVAVSTLVETEPGRLPRSAALPERRRRPRDHARRPASSSTCCSPSRPASGETGRPPRPQGPERSTSTCSSTARPRSTSRASRSPIPGCTSAPSCSSPLAEVAPGSRSARPGDGRGPEGRLH